MLKLQIPKDKVLTRMQQEGVSEKMINTVLGVGPVSSTKPTEGDKDQSGIDRDVDCPLQYFWMPGSGPFDLCRKTESLAPTAAGLEEATVSVADLTRGGCQPPLRLSNAAKGHRKTGCYPQTVSNLLTKQEGLW